MSGDDSAPTGPADGSPAGPSDAEETLAVTPERAVRRSTPADVPELAPGATVGGRYRLTGQVAVDAAGNRFWRARDTVLPRDMAVTLMPDSSGTSATVARTLRAGRLHHIGLPQTLDLGTDHGQTFVVGQWVDGATLTDLLAKGPLEPGVATAIAGKISEAVAEAHRNGLSLGSINPSLIRVNVDGQARFSHVIAHATAAPDDDIRAVGALLYLMLTATWPSSDHVPVVPGADLRQAPQRSGRELPANLVVDGVPAALAQLTNRALHPEDPDGIHAVGALATLLRAPDVAPTPAPGALPGAAVASELEQPPPTMSPADRKLRKERRLKIGVASAFIAAFVALILIVVGTLAKNTLGSIAESNQVALAPLPETSRVAPTTASAATSRPPSGSVTSAPGPSSAPPSSAAPAPLPVTVTNAEVYDPEGQGEKDYTDLVDRLYDGDPSTEWLTFSYKQQFRPKAEGGYKAGVGVVLQFDVPVNARSVDITPGTGMETGMTIEIRSVSGLTPGPLSSTQLLATAQVGGPTVIELPNAPKSPYLLIFVTQVPGSGTKWQGKIGEISVQGNP